MKAAFYIPVKRHHHDPLFLLLEISNHAVSFLWYHQSPCKLAGLAIYHTSHPLTGENLTQLVNAEGLLEHKVEKVSVCFDVKESTLVPAMYFRQHEIGHILNHLHGKEEGMLYHSGMLANEARLMYRVPTSIIDFITNTYPEGSLFHATEKQVFNRNDSRTSLHALFSHNAIKLILFKGNHIQYVGYHQYQTATDAAYHLLNACRQHQANLDELRLHLSGMIEKESPLFKELYTYFPELQFNELPEGWQAEGLPEDYPGHYFSHLMDLASCAS